MKIKTVKKMNLPELIQYVWEKDDVLGEFTSNCGTTLYTSNLGSIRIEHAHKYIGKEELFTVEVEEELTEETGIHGATFVYYDELSREVKPFRYADVTSPTLKHIIQPRSGTVALAVFRGKQLIWTKDTGIPESGVLEVGAE